MPRVTAQQVTKLLEAALPDILKSGSSQFTTLLMVHHITGYAGGYRQDGDDYIEPAECANVAEVLHGLRLDQFSMPRCKEAIQALTRFWQSEFGQQVGAIIDDEEVLLMVALYAQFLNQLRSDDREGQQIYADIKRQCELTPQVIALLLALQICTPPSLNDSAASVSAARALERIAQLFTPPLQVVR